MNKNLFPLVMVVMLVLAGCTPGPGPLPTVPPPPTPTGLPELLPTATSSFAPLPVVPSPAPTASSQTTGSAVVAFVKDGDIQVWEEATGQSETIYDAGDVISVTMSEDGQALAFLRRSVVQRSDLDWYEQSALWTVQRNGENPRELVPAEELRELLNASETDSTNIPQLEWIPGAHRLLYTGWTYLVMAEGESHASPQGLFQVDADSGSKSVLLPAGTSPRFFPSPDGRQIALLSTTDLSFINADGSNLRQAVFAYPATGVPGRIIPGGVWTQDAGSFVLAAPGESASEFVSNIVIWRVPVDGSPAQSLAAINDSSHDSITFSPDGRSVAYFRADSPAILSHYGWFVAPLVPEAGPLAAPRSTYLFAKNLHWSPAGQPYAIHEGALDRLCPDAAQDVEVCQPGPVLGEQLAEIYWIDGDRFLFVTREPYDLYFGRTDGARVRIAEGVERFAAARLECKNDAGFAAGGEGPVDFSVAAGSMFVRTWRLRNAGACAWDRSYRLVFLDGERLSGPHSLPLEETVPPGGELELSVNLLAPTDPGTYQAEWQLVDPQGAPFGVRLPVDIEVQSVTVTEFAPDQIVAKIPAEPGPISLGEGALWLLSGQAVSRIDLETNQVVATIPVGEFPSALATGFGSVWAAANGTVYRIDPQTDQVRATIPIDPSIGLHCLAAGAGSVWACNGEAGLVHRIDPDTNQVSAAITVEPGPSQVATLEEAVWFINQDGLRRIDPETNEISAAVSLDCTSRSLAVDPTAVWVPCEGTPALFRIDPQTNRVLARIGVGPHPYGVAPDGNSVWVTSITGDTLARIDPAINQATAVYRVGDVPGNVISSQGELFVSTQGAIWRIRP